MNSVGTRRLAAEGGIGLALCVGLLLGVVEPVERRTQAVREAAAAAEQCDATSQGESPEAARRVLAEALAAADEVDRMSKPARSQSELLAAVLRLADEQSVRVEQIEPTLVVGRAVPVAAAAPGAAPGSGAAASGGAVPAVPAKPDMVLGCSLSAQGDYASLVAFVDQLERSAGFARVRTLRFAAPGDSAGRTVMASVLSEHVAFDVLPVRAAAGLVSAAKEGKE